MINEPAHLQVCLDKEKEEYGGGERNDQQNGNRVKPQQLEINAVVNIPHFTNGQNPLRIPLASYYLLISFIIHLGPNLVNLDGPR